MAISKSEFCRFSLSGRKQLTEEFGELLFTTQEKQTVYRVYRVFDWYVEVEVRVEAQLTKLVSVEVISRPELLKYMRKSS